MERMEERNDSDKCGDDFMLPGFRFHPTDEELVEFYLKRKLEHRPLPIELIKQVDIYKYDPWDLPKLASTGEKEWYFYCPRDRKYRNSTRPNRVTGSGFWKATGTDRPIYSSDGGKCIGLKKSLVFYRGRAAKGIKTDWMMHEFRLPSTTTDGGGGGGGGPPHPPPKKIFDKTLPLTDSWAICRIFKKTNSTANRGISISHNWTPSLSTTTSSDAFTYTPFTSESDHFQTLSALNIPSYTTKPSSTGKTSTLTSANEDYFFPGNLVFSEASNKTTTVDLTSPMFLHGEASKNSDSLDFDATQQQQQQQHHYNLVMQESINGEDEGVGLRKNANIHHLWENIRFPFSLPAGQEPWKANLPWDSPPCPSEMSSTTYSTNKSYI